MKKELFCKCLAEFLGTFAIVFFGCGAIAIGHLNHDASLLSQVPLIFGLVVGLMIYAVGHISGAHFNPAVTWAFCLVKRFPLKEVPAYWSAQFLGAIAGCALLFYFLPQIIDFGATTIHLPLLKALLFEALLSFFLMFVIIAVATDSRAVGIMAGAAIGITVTVDAYVGGSLTGASMNPARSLAPALFEKHYDHLWIYFVGPFLGTSLAAWLYEYMRCEKKEEGDENKPHAKGCC